MIYLVLRKLKRKYKTQKVTGLIILTSSFVFMINLAAFSQEICNNGIDDDGNGLIDLNDISQCSCVNTYTTVNSIIPNPSFESSSCEPVILTELDCVVDWFQGNNATADYFNTVSHFGAALAHGIVPPPHGSGYIGAIYSDDWMEYFASCLTNPMISGTSYRLTFKIASGYADGYGLDVGPNIPPPTSVVLYGNSNCVSSINTDLCPTGINGWYVLGQATTTGSAGWQTMTINFTPPSNVNAMMIGPSCSASGTSGVDGSYDYHYYDNLVLSTPGVFQNITSQGSWCDNNLVLSVPHTSGGTYQWFKDGIALVGETSRTIDLSGNNYTDGTYNLITYLPGNCKRRNITIAPITIIDPTIDPQAPTCINSVAFNLNASSTDGTWSGTGITDPLLGTFDPQIAGIGTHEITFDQNGICYGSSTSNIIVNSKPSANFSSVNVCSEASTNFTDQSTIPAPEVITNWNWFFYDGQTSTLQNPEQIFINEGIHTNKLVVTSENGCIDSITKDITVYPLPIPAFTALNNCFSFISNFTNNSSISNQRTQNSIDFYNWDFGDGTTSNLESPSHLYTAPGTYSAQLITISQFGCRDTIASDFTVYPLPEASFSVNPVCLGSESYFIDNSTIIDPDNIASWSWIFGDGITSTDQNPIHVFLDENEYSDTLLVISNHGCKTSTVAKNTVWPLPQVNFSVQDACLNFANVFLDLSQISSQNTINSNSSWFWDFGDGNTEYVQNTNHVYSSDGNYNVKLLVTSNNGCKDSITKTAIVYPKPNAIIDGENLIGCSPICPTLTSSSTVNSPSTITNVVWEYSDGAFDNNSQSIRCFDNINDHTDYYDVTLYTETEKGCRDTATNLNFIQVYHLPIADFTFSPQDPDIHRNRVEFYNNSLYASTFDWVFSNNEYSSKTDPEIIFDDGPGFYSAHLTAVTYNGCEDTISKQVFVKDIATYWIPNTFTPDGNERNNTWKPVIYSGIDESSIYLRIFNRWGEMLWETFDTSIGWDGTFNGKLVQEGTYSWMFDYKVKSRDEFKTETGHVNVLK